MEKQERLYGQRVEVESAKVLFLKASWQEVHHMYLFDVLVVSQYFARTKWRCLLKGWNLSRDDMVDL